MGVFVHIEIADACAARPGCFLCVEQCPKVILFKKEQRACIRVSEEDECLVCRRCELACPEKAIRVQKLY